MSYPISSQLVRMEFSNFTRDNSESCSWNFTLRDGRVAENVIMTHEVAKTIARGSFIDLKNFFNNRGIIEHTSTQKSFREAKGLEEPALKEKILKSIFGENAKPGFKKIQLTTLEKIGNFLLIIFTLGYSLHTQWKNYVDSLQKGDIAAATRALKYGAEFCLHPSCLGGSSPAFLSSEQIINLAKANLKESLQFHLAQGVVGSIALTSVRDCANQDLEVRKWLLEVVPYRACDKRDPDDNWLCEVPTGEFWTYKKASPLTLADF